jgi:prepilin-type N-terminal cleavage/methylation domain-containing protein
MRNTKSGFTLVELIVVITILAILGTIAFISLGSYTADARNSTRLDGISKIATAVENGLISATPVVAYVADSANALTGQNVGWVALTTGANYNAGNMNASALNVNADQFKDPKDTTQGYRIGATVLGGTRFQVAASVEDGSSARKSAVRGSYTQRTNATKPIVVTSTGGVNQITGVRLTVVTDINFFNEGDTTTAGVISTISNDGLNMVIVPSVTNSSPTTIALSSSEALSIIGDANTVTAATLANPVVDGSGTVLPY